MVDLSLVDPKNLWYVIGLIATDGNLSMDNRHINITSKDVKFLEEVKTALLLTNKITMKSRGGRTEKIYGALQFGDVKFYKYLLAVGLTPNKSLTLKELNIPKDYFLDFLRGVIDGDGNIHTWIHRSNKNRQWALRIFSGSPIFANWLKVVIEDVFQVKGKIYKEERRASFLYILKFGKFAAKIILQRCYYQNCLAMARKLLTVRKCLNSENGLSKYGNVVADWSALM